MSESFYTYMISLDKDKRAPCAYIQDIGLIVKNFNESMLVSCPVPTSNIVSRYFNVVPVDPTVPKLTLYSDSISLTSNSVKVRQLDLADQDVADSRRYLPIFVRFENAAQIETYLDHVHKNVHLSNDLAIYTPCLISDDYMLRLALLYSSYA